MTKLILIDEYWNELERINLFACEDNDTKYIQLESDDIDYTLDAETMLLLENNELELLNNGK